LKPQIPQISQIRGEGQRVFAIYISVPCEFLLRSTLTSSTGIIMESE